MVNNKQVLAVAASLFAQQALALNVHRHGHGGFHAKKDVVVVEATDVVTVTDWSVVTVYPDGSPVEVAEATTSASPVTEQQAPAAAATTSSSSTTPATTLVAVTTTSSKKTPTPTPTTTSTTTPAAKAAQVKVEETTSTSTTPTPTPTPTTSTKATPTTTSSTAAATTSAASSSGNKRGLAYNAGDLLSPFLSSGSKISWSYNWGQTADSSAPSDLEFVPMMWGPTHADGWSENAETAIANGATNFLSFNEPDNAGQANLDAATAASLHQQYLNPYSGKVRISTPAITNSHNAGEGTEWLANFITACDGKCDYDFCAAHWYNSADTTDFLNQLLEVYDVCGKNVWITEFAPTGSDDEINTFLAEVMDQMDNNSTFSFVERYSYFMAATGSLLTSTTSLSTYGNTYAYN